MDARVKLKQNEHVVVANGSYFEECDLFGLSTFGAGYSNCAFSRCVIAWADGAGLSINEMARDEFVVAARGP